MVVQILLLIKTTFLRTYGVICDTHQYIKEAKRVNPFHFVCRNENAKLADIFLKKGPYLKMYSTYIREFDKNVTLLEEQTKKNPAFGAIVRKFEVMVPAEPVFSV